VQSRLIKKELNELADKEFEEWEKEYDAAQDRTAMIIR
jgi:hypothetical protein